MEQKKVVDVQSLPKGGPYSHAIISGGFVFVSGQSGQVKGKHVSFDEQCKNSMTKIIKILEEAGTCVENIVKINVYLANPQDFEHLNDLFGEFQFKANPARTTVITKFVFDEILIEIDVIAAL